MQSDFENLVLSIKAGEANNWSVDELTLFLNKRGFGSIGKTLSKKNKPQKYINNSKF